MNFVQKPSPPEQDLARPILPASPSPWRNPSAFIPGLTLSAAIAASAMLLRFVPGMAAISSMVVAFIFGMVLSGPLGGLAIMSPGTRLAAKTLLRCGVALLGFQLTVYQLADLGARTLLIVVVVLIATFLFTKWIGRVLGVDRALTELIAAGTSVCGASAIIATNAVAKAPDQEVGYAVACVSLFGTLAMIVYPLLFTAFHFDIRTYGLWAGSSVHEVAQVVAAAFQADPSAGHIAVPVKLARVALLAPLVFTLDRCGSGATASPAAQDSPGFRCSLSSWSLSSFLSSSTAPSRSRMLGGAGSSRPRRFSSLCRWPLLGLKPACGICGTRACGRSF